MTHATNSQCRPLLRGILRGPLSWTREDPPQPYCTVAVWCPYCRDLHYHGWHPEHDGRHAEHRTAHCTFAESPFNETGYWISTVRTGEPGYSDHLFRPGQPVNRQPADTRQRIQDTLP